MRNNVSDNELVHLKKNRKPKTKNAQDFKF